MLFNTDLISQTLSSSPSRVPFANLTNSSWGKNIVLQLRANKHPVCVMDILMSIVFL